MSPVVNFGDVRGAEPIPADTYTLECSKAKAGLSKSERPKIELQWKVIGGKFDGRIVFDTISFAETVLWRAKKALTAMGFPTDLTLNTDDPAALDALAEQMPGITISANVKIEENRGTNPETGEPYDPQNRIARYGPRVTTLDSLLG